MPVEPSQLRDLLLPGLVEIRYPFFSYQSLEGVFGAFEAKLTLAEPIIMPKPHIWVPKLTLPEAALVGAAAAIIENPEVTRRFWQGWFK